MKAEKIIANKAQPAGDKHAKSVVIEIVEEFPDTGSLEANNYLHLKNAMKISDALINSLPQGTLDKVVANLLMNASKKNNLVVSGVNQPVDPDGLFCFGTEFEGHRKNGEVYGLSRRLI